MHRNATLLNSSAMERLRSLSAPRFSPLSSYHPCPRFIPPLARSLLFPFHPLFLRRLVEPFPLSFSPTSTWFNICTQIERKWGNRQYFPSAAYQARRWQNGGKGKREGSTTSWDESMGTGRWGSLIGLHNIDSITGEFFAALRASSMLSQW